MPIDASKERLLTITAATKVFPNRPHLTTVWRWIQHGTNGIRLETIKIGGRRYTSHEAIGRFIAKSTASSSVAPVQAATPAQRRRRRERVAAELTAAGI